MGSPRGRHRWIVPGRRSAIICKYSVISGGAVVPNEVFGQGAMGSGGGARGRLFGARSNSCNYAAYDKSIAFNYTRGYLRGFSSSHPQPRDPQSAFPFSSRAPPTERKRACVTERLLGQLSSDPTSRASPFVRKVDSPRFPGDIRPLGGSD